MSRLVGWVLPLVTLTGCGVVCTTEARPGIVVTIVDASTGAPLAGPVTVTVWDGEYSETVTPPETPSGTRVAALAWERPGRYRVEVRAPGYVTWVGTEVRVLEDECHVRPVELTARLEAGGG